MVLLFEFGHSLKRVIIKHLGMFEPFLDLVLSSAIWEELINSM